jgi:hypothetical protein
MLVIALVMQFQSIDSLETKLGKTPSVETRTTPTYIIQQLRVIRPEPYRIPIRPGTYVTLTTVVKGERPFDKSVSHF